MRSAVIVLAAVLALSAAAPLPAHLQTAGNPYALNITHDEVVGNVEGANLGWSMFKQCDSAWGGNRLGSCSLTICQAGCAMRCVA